MPKGKNTQSDQKYCQLYRANTYYNSDKCTRQCKGHKVDATFKDIKEESMLYIIHLNYQPIILRII